VSQTGGHGDSRTREQGGGNDHCCSSDGEFMKLVDGVPAALQAARELMRKGAQHVKVRFGSLCKFLKAEPGHRSVHQVEFPVLQVCIYLFDYSGPI